ncbi:MAG: dUTP diphosphatase [Alphaproteobacteria bacterium]|nr:dUTP diphosphatase [Alphaproteobacteria bacterium]
MPNHIAPITVNIQQLPHGADIALPKQASDGAAGFDLCAAIPDNIILSPNEYQLIPTGFAIALSQNNEAENYEAQIRPRSGLALKYGVTVLNSPGTIDADYRGEINVLLINHGKQDFIITPQMRIAQMVIARHEVVKFELCAALPATKRGENGFGSTGA